jgi:hypothetical protein
VRSAVCHPFYLTDGRSNNESNDNTACLANLGCLGDSRLGRPETAAASEEMNNLGCA